MAKSLRSKWRRKCRAVKRVTYGKKELAVLKKTLGLDPNDPASDTVKVINIGQKVIPSQQEQRRKEQPEATASAESNDGDKMETNVGEKKYNPKTMRDQHGNYPVWMSQRKTKSGRKAKASKVTKKKNIKKRK